MDTLTNETSLRLKSDRVLDDLRQFDRAWVTGCPESGLHSLACSLDTRIDGAQLLELPPHGPDAATHAKIRLAARVGLPVDASLDDTLQEIERRGETLIVVVPYGWGARWRDESAAFSTVEFAFLESIAYRQRLKVVFMTRMRFKFPRRNPFPPTIRLPRLPVDWSALQTEAWRDVSEFTDAFRDSWQSTEDVSPSMVGLAIALAMLGANETNTDPDFDVLCFRLLERLKASENSVARKFLIRIAECRFPVPKQTMQRLGNGQMTSLAKCLGSYEATGAFRFQSVVRYRLLVGLHREPTDLADDRVEVANALTSNRTTDEPSQITTNLEKLHHLAGAGLRGNEEWNKLSARFPAELMIDRAVSLSCEYSQYTEAATVYDNCIQRLNPQTHPSLTAYAWHYLAFNRDRAGRPLPDVEPGYKKAIELDKRNLWHNSRLITFWIRSALFRRAESEFPAAVRRCCGKDAEFEAFEFYRWIAEEWWKHGRFSSAAQAFNKIDRAIIEKHAVLQDLRQRILDSYEVERLGEMIYSPSYPIELRWGKTPPVELGSGAFAEWYPGRVIDADEFAVNLLVAVPNQQIAKRQLIRKSIPADEWELAAGTPSAAASGFCFVGVTTENEIRIVVYGAPSKTTSPLLHDPWTYRSDTVL